MILEPGLLNDLSGQGQLEWEDYVKNELADAKQASGSSQLVLPDDPDLLSDIIIVDWKGLPVRIRECLQSSSKTQELLDWIQNGQPFGRIFGAHEEYLEWRVVKDALDRIVRIEFTSETPEFWRILAKHHPARTLRLLADFAGETDPAKALDVYGVPDPLTLSIEDREAAFISMMFPSEENPNIRSPYNNGQKSIAFMTVGPNTLHAAVNLAAFAAIPYVKEVGGDKVALQGREAIRFTRQAAQDCRDSDPTIVGTVVEAATAQRKISLFNPLGLYIADVDNKSILMPDGETPIPQDWFTFQRGSKIVNGGSTIFLSQRLVFEVPQSSGLTISELIDENTDKPIEFGAQVASRVTVALYALASEKNTTNVPLIEVETDDVPPCREEPACGRVKSIFETFENSQAQSDLGEGPASNLRGNVDGG